MKCKPLSRRRCVERQELGRGRERAVLVLGRDHAVFLHAAEHIGEPLLGAIRMTVGIEEARSLEQARQHRAFGDAEILRGFAEIAARGHLDAPGAAAEIGRIQIEFEDFRLLSVLSTREATIISRILRS